MSKSQPLARSLTINVHESDFDSDLHLDPDIGAENEIRQARIFWLVQCSLWGNVLLFSVKLYASIVSHSLAVIGSMLDSFLDLLTQVVVFSVERCSKLRDKEQYPAGLSRLEPIGVIFCASIMGMAALELVFHSTMQLFAGSQPLWFNAISITILVVAIVIKIVLYIFCSALSKHSGVMLALAEDHRNDSLPSALQRDATTEANESDDADEEALQLNDDVSESVHDFWKTQTLDRQEMNKKTAVTRLALRLTMG
ncbi:hypothetical protein AAMO2058_001514400 [Amorphochlora amoebiformis]